MDVIPRWADEYRGIPFAENGYTRDGLNCWGLCCLVYKEQLGIDLPRFALSASNAKACARQVEESRSDWLSVLRNAIRQFDLVLMRDMGRSIVRHVGVMVSPIHVMHIEFGTDVHCDEIASGLVAPRIVSFLRHPSLA